MRYKTRASFLLTLLALLAAGCASGPATDEPVASPAGAAPGAEAPGAAAAMPPPDADYDPGLELSFATNDWERQLSTDIELVETRAERFIEASSRLYDLLIKIEDGDIAGWSRPVDAALLASVKRYGELIDAVETFQAHVTAADVKAALVVGETGEAEFREVLALLSRFQRPKTPATCYAEVRGRLLTTALFRDDVPADAGLASIPHTQRDALALLDFLRRVAADLTMLSGAVTAWVAAPERGDNHPRGITLDSLAH